MPHRVPSPASLELVDRVDDLLDARYREALSLSKIARAVGRNPSYLSGLYRRVRGVTMTERLTELRVSHARSMLQWNSRSMLEIATASGFGSLSRFYDAYTRLTGGPPGRERAASAPAAAREVSSFTQAIWVDDSPQNNIRERRMLLSRGVAVDSYSSGEQGLAALAFGGYSVVISDIRRPDAARSGTADSGWTFAETVRERWPEIPIIFYCGYADPVRRTRARQLGALGVLTRPNELIAAVLAALTRQSAPQVKIR